MKKVFDWLREQIDKEYNHYMRMADYTEDEELRAFKHGVSKGLDMAHGFINEAEAKFGGHAICYLDSPCEYQNEDISVTKTDEYYKEIRAMAQREIVEWCFDNKVDFAILERYADKERVVDCVLKHFVAEQLKEERNECA